MPDQQDDECCDEHGGDHHVLQPWPLEFTRASLDLFHLFDVPIGWMKMGILAWIVVGIIAGFLAKAVVPGEGPGGVLGDLVVGVIGALLGGWLFNMFGHIGATGINLWSILVAFVGGVVLLLIIRLLTGRRAPA
jgi:uncharacterized membrane protein YeaQ/YmgE (transglycosylase-associated protein family)